MTGGLACWFKCIMFQTPWWCPCKPDSPDLLRSSRRCPAIIRLEACPRSTSHCLDSSDPPGHENTGDWWSGADSWQVVLATNCNGGMIRPNALRHEWIHALYSVSFKTHCLCCVSIDSDVTCRRKKLEGLGWRLLDRFKQEYEQKKKKKNHKEKRNSTKKELREDGEVLSSCDVLRAWTKVHWCCCCSPVFILRIHLRLRKIVVERVTVVKFGVDNRGSDGTGCFRIKVRTDTAEFADMRIAGPYCLLWQSFTSGVWTNGVTLLGVLCNALSHENEIEIMKFKGSKV